MVVIKTSGITAFEIKDGAYNADDFKTFWKQNFWGLFLENRDDILIMDNCRFHHSRLVTEFLSANSINFKFLPIYSPQLNLIEEFFFSF
jgi:transposase